MTREEIIKEWESVLSRDPLDAPWDLIDETLALLKEQEAVEPHSHMTDDSDLYFTCGKCGHVIWSESYKFCPMCATQIAWNGEGR